MIGVGAARHQAAGRIGRRTDEISIPRYYHPVAAHPPHAANDVGERKPARRTPFTGGFSCDWHGTINFADARRVVRASFGGTGGYRAVRSTYWRREIGGPIVVAFQST